MRALAVLGIALGLAACGGPSGPDGPIDDNAGMMISNETVMSDAVDEAGNAAAPTAAANAVQ